MTQYISYGFAIVFLWINLVFTHPANGKADVLLRATPESQGVSSVALLKFVETLDQEIHEMHGFMLLRQGQVIAEGMWAPYDARQNHVMYSLSLLSSAEGMSILLEREGGEFSMPIGFQSWKKCRGMIGPFMDEPLAVSGAWSSADTCSIKVLGCETPYALTCSLRFDQDRVFVNSELNVAFGPTKQPELIGQLVSD